MHSSLGKYVNEHSTWTLNAVYGIRKASGDEFNDDVNKHLIVNYEKY